VALQVASLFGVLRMDDSQFRTSAGNAKTEMTGLGDRMVKLGGQMTTFGSNLTLLAAPVAAAVGGATKMAIDFDEAMVNIQAVTGRSTSEMATLRDEVMKLGGASRFGPQAAAEAMYDIVGGVADASTHMAIFRTAISTAQAGNADLGATTKALISVMNSYKLGADQAGMASDVLTRTVGMGVGTMDEFASSLPTVTGLANSLGISFSDLAGWSAYLTTQGNSAGQATTQLGAMMSAVMKPNADMAAGLKELGFDSGEAAVKQLGLVGTMQALAGTHTANEQGMAAMLGTQEALRGSTALMSQDVAGFMTTFTGGLQGATQAAEAVQMTSAAAQVDLLKSSVSELGIEVGTAMIPALKDLVRQVMPVISNVIKWVKENPELIRQVGQIAILAVGAGTAITAVGTATSAIGNIVKIATTPVGAFAAAILAVYTAYQKLQEFKATVAAGQQSVVSAHGGAIASGQISKQQYEDQAFKSLVSQFGDFAARMMWGDENSLTRRTLMQPYYASLSGAPGAAGGIKSVPYDGYMVNLHQGEGVLTEAENRERWGGMNFGEGSIVIYANDYAGGQAAAKGFSEQMQEWRRSRG